MKGLVKPPQRRQGPDLCPLWFLVGTSFGQHTWARFQPGGAIRPYSDVAKYIFDIYYLLTMLFVYWFLWPLRLVWLLVCCLYKEVYLQIFKCVSFWLHGCCGEWEGGPVNQINHTSWVAVVTPTDRPKSVRNCCLIELFCGVVCVVTLPFWHFCWCRGFCHRTGSDLLLFVLISGKLNVIASFPLVFYSMNRVHMFRNSTNIGRKGRRALWTPTEILSGGHRPHGTLKKWQVSKDNLSYTVPVPLVQPCHFLVNP